ncbi:MAG: pyruvate kinase, partial [Eubacteriales bacterium]
MEQIRKTKIICTLGPASDTEETIRSMICAGMDVARINFSHGEYDGHRQKADIVKKLREEMGRHTALLLDTKGPEIRLGKFKNSPVTLAHGNMFTLFCGGCELGDENGVAVSYPGLWKDVHIGSRILIDDGLIELVVEHCDESRIDCRVENGGQISDRKSVNVPGATISIPFLSEKDIADIEFGVKEDFDFIAASFTQCADNIKQIRHELEKRHCRSIRII